MYPAETALIELRPSKKIRKENRFTPNMILPVQYFTLNNQGAGQGGLSL